MTIKEVLEQFVKNQLALQVLLCRVTAVDKAKALCDVEPVNGQAEMFDVRLRAVADGETSGMVIYPKVGSLVLVALIENDYNSAFVAMCSEVDEIIINGGSFGGLVNAKELKKELDKTNAVVQAIMQTLTTWVVAPSDGGLALKTAMITALTGKVLGNFTKLENEKIKHG